MNTLYNILKKYKLKKISSGGMHAEKNPIALSQYCHIMLKNMINVYIYKKKSMNQKLLHVTKHND